MSIKSGTTRPSPSSSASASRSTSPHRSSQAQVVLGVSRNSLGSDQEGHIQRPVLRTRSPRTGSITETYFNSSTTSSDERVTSAAPLEIPPVVHRRHGSQSTSASPTAATAATFLRRAAAQIMDDIGSSMPGAQKKALGVPLPRVNRRTLTMSSTPDAIPHYFSQIPPTSWRTLLILAILLLFFWWIANDCPPDCSLLPPIHPANACSYSEEELTRILRLPRGFKPGEPRYYFGGRWVDYLTVQFELEMWKPHPSKQKEFLAPCILVSIDEQLPCITAACIIPIYLRPLTSDLLVLKAHLEDDPQILAPLERDLEAQHQHFSSVLDAGANIGVSTALLSLMFPHARIIAVESCEHNFRLLRLNTLAYPNVVPVHAALWDQPGPPLVVHRDPRASGYAALVVAEQQNVPLFREWVDAKEDFPFGVAAPLDVPLLLSLFGLHSFDLLRMDIEGAEMRVLSSSSRGYPFLMNGTLQTSKPLWWIERLKMAIVGTHENLVPGSEQAVRAAFPLSRFRIEFGNNAACSVFRRRDVFQDTDAKVST